MYVICPAIFNRFGTTDLYGILEYNNHCVDMYVFCMCGSVCMGILVCLSKGCFSIN
jgi:hypothetical protein